MVDVTFKITFAIQILFKIVAPCLYSVHGSFLDVLCVYLDPNNRRTCPPCHFILCYYIGCCKTNVIKILIFYVFYRGIFLGHSNTTEEYD